MKNIRLQFQVLTAFSVIINLLIWGVGDWLKPHAYTATEWWLAVVAGALTLIVSVDGLLASHYLSMINASKKLDGRTMSALQDASVWRLRRVAMAADQLMAVENAYIQQTLAKAKDYPSLLESKEFQRTVYGFKFEKAEKMIAQAKLAAKRIAEEEVRRQSRQQNKMENLVSEGRSLGISTEKMHSVSPTELRDLIEQTREKEALRNRAVLLGCSTYIEQFLERGDHAGANVFLIRAESAVKSARQLALESAVRELVAYGNLPAVDKLLKSKKDEIEVAALIERTQDRIRKLPEPHRPALQKRLDNLRAAVYPSREFQKVLHDLEAALENIKA